MKKKDNLKSKKMKKVFSVLSVAAVMFFMGGSAKAQVAVEAGYDLQAAHIERTPLVGNVIKTDTAFRGIYLGVNYTQTIAGELSINAGVYFNTNYTQEKNKLTNVTETWGHVGALVPVTLNFACRISDDVRIKFFAGPQFDFGIGALKYNDKNDDKVDMYNRDNSTYPALQEYEMKRFGIAGLLGFRFEFYRIYVRASFSLGFNDMAKEDNVTWHSGRLNLGVGYIF